jgi:[acyl-carrier-protein] S-malonyltransferase
LYLQVPGTVRWSESMKTMAALGVVKAVEVGAGAVLSGLMRQNQPGVTMAKFGEPADLEKLRELLG